MLTIDYALLGIKEGERVLDIGCGAGRHSFEAYKYNCRVYALDVGEENLAKTGYILRLMEEQSGAEWTLLRADALRLPFRDSCFDKVICSEVLEHLYQDEQAIGEMVRVLKDDGKLGISVPTYLSETIFWKLSRDYCRQPGGHVRKYKAGEIIALLQQHGLRIYAIRRKHALHSFYWLLRCLFGLKRENALIPSVYHRFLVWDINTKTRPIRLLESLLDHFMAKSVVYYAYKAKLRDYGTQTQGDTRTLSRVG